MQLFQKPKWALKKMGANGEMLAKGMEEVQDFVDISTARGVAGLSRAASRLKVSLTDSKLSGDIVNYLIKKRDSSGKLVQNYDPNAVALGRELESLFTKLDNQLNTTGVINDADLSALKKSKAKHGFWPVVLDATEIEGAKGRAKWVSYFSGGEGQAFNRQALEETIKAIVPDVTMNPVLRKLDSAPRRKLLAGVVPHPDRPDLAILTREAAEDLWHKKSSNPFSVLHRHTLDTTGIRSVLEPFLSKDLGHVLYEYFQFAHRKIANAATFGPKHEMAIDMLRGIDKEVGRAQALQSAETYFDHARSMLSKNVATSTMRAGSTWSNVEGRIKAYETLKLALAAIPNMAQVLSFAPIYIARQQGMRHPMLPLVETTKAFVKSLSSTNRAEVLSRTGANIETTVVQHLGEMARINHSIFGKELTGILSVFEWINNPSKFLRVAGFLGIENFNRAFAANIGEGYAQTLANQRAAAYAKQNAPEIKRVEALLEELGINPRDVPTSSPNNEPVSELMREWDVSRAGLRFSNAVNFRNTAPELPNLLRSPYAGLFRQFKTFLIHQQSFYYHNVIKPATKGNLVPLAYLMGAVGTMGAAVHNVRQEVKTGLEMTGGIAQGRISPTSKQPENGLLRMMRK
jgi:hypothetical protein